jgi:fructose-bisphosphate aldolase class I
MTVPGKKCPAQALAGQVAEATVRTLRGAVPPAVPGIVFLSGGQTPRHATEHLSAMNAMGRHPWELSFSYGRALQDPVLAAWKGDAANVSAARKAFFHRSKLNGAARFGRYAPAMEEEV